MIFNQTRWTFTDTLVVVLGLAGALTVSDVQYGFNQLSQAVASEIPEVMPHANPDGTISMLSIEQNSLMEVFASRGQQKFLIYNFEKGEVCGGIVGLGKNLACRSFFQMADLTKDRSFEIKQHGKACEVARFTGQKDFYKKFCL